MSTEAKKLIQHVCKDFPSFSCQGKGLQGFIVNGKFSAENIFTTLFIYMYCSLMQTGQAQPIRVHIITIDVILSDGTYALIYIVAHK